MNANQSSKTRRTRIVQSTFVTALAVVAIAANPGTPAQASHPVEGPGAATTTFVDNVTSPSLLPCFNVPTPDRWPGDVGAVPTC